MNARIQKKCMYSHNIVGEYTLDPRNNEIYNMSTQVEENRNLFIKTALSH